jgi:hypothetical protein
MRYSNLPVRYLFIEDHLDPALGPSNETLARPCTCCNVLKNPCLVLLSEAPGIYRYRLGRNEGLARVPPAPFVLESDATFQTN